MDLNAIQVILVIVVAFLAGMEGVLDEWEFHQPLVAMYFNRFSYWQSYLGYYARWFFANDRFRLGQHRCRYRT